MISICIPVYNFNVRRLVQALEIQKTKSTYPIEILLIDDGSEQKIKEENAPYCLNHRYIELNGNIGRSRVRNLFVKHAAFTYLLFLDCDSLIIKDNFLSCYTNTLGFPAKRLQVICGGREYPVKAPGKNRLLRYKYGVQRESKSATERQKHPNRSFMTNNFLVKKELIETIGFDENLSGYGHEDTLFGLELQSQNIEVVHIDNPVLNGDIETNAEYLEKTRQGIINLVHILHHYPNRALLIENVTLLKTYFKIKNAVFLLRIFFPFLRGFTLYLLNRGIGTDKLFAFYKLLLIAVEIKRSSQKN